MVSEEEFVEEVAREESSKPMASEAPKILDDDRHYIVKHPSGDAVLDDNGNKILLIKYLEPPGDRTEGVTVCHYKRIVAGQKISIPISNSNPECLDCFRRKFPASSRRLFPPTC